MKLTILGSGSAVITKKRASASMMLEVGEKLLLFDCGWGVPLNILRAGFDIQKIDHILISHPHADHMGSLINILQSIFVSGIFYPKTKRIKPIYLHGYFGFKKNLEILIKIMSPELKIVKLPFKIKVFEYQQNQRIIGNLKISSHEVKHFPNEFHSVAFRIDYSKKSFVYSGDCGYDENLIKLVKNTDLAAIEATINPDYYQKFGPFPNHLSANEAGVIAQKAKIKKLVLFHLYDKLKYAGNRIKAAQENFKDEVIIAKDLMKINF